MNRQRLAIALLVLTAALPGPAQNGPRSQAVRDFDIRDFSAASQTPSAAQPLQSRILLERRRAGLDAFLTAERRAAPGTRITANRFGIAKSFVRDGAALSAPSNRDPEEIAKSFLRDHAAIFPFSESEIGSLRLLSRSSDGGATVLAYAQTAGGLDVFNGIVKFTLSAAGEVVQAGAADSAPGVAVFTTPRLSAEQAVRAAFASLNRDAPAALARDASLDGKDGKTAFENPNGGRYNAITAELSVFPVDASGARLAYRIFFEADRASYYEILVDAENGALLFRHNLYVFQTAAGFGKGNVFLKSPGMADQRSFRQLVNFGAGWLPDASRTVTIGNNVDAFLDADGDDYPDAYSADPNLLGARAYSPSQVFDFAYGDGILGWNPREYPAAAVTNLFYFVNVAHDYFYDLGFTEAAGNFQTNNFGKGGKENDPVRAEAQSGWLIDNAEFAPLPDGYASSLIAGVFTRDTNELTDDLDSDYDGTVMLHEYTHGVSSRLVGSGTSVSCLDGLQSAAMGEGWSDYFAASYFNDPVTGAYILQDPNGIRRQSYEGYTFTYEDIGNNGYEVHNDGEIWAATLWDLRKSLGQTVADRLVLQGLKSTPCSPSMTDGRDAILVADQAANGGSNRAAIWKVFAKHGMGNSAKGADGDELTGIRYDAAYDLPEDLQAAKNPVIESNPFPTQLGMGEVYSYQIQASNPNGGVLRYALKEGPAGMALDPASGRITWTAAFTGFRVKIGVSDGAGGSVIHGFLLPVLTKLTPGNTVAISGPIDTYGFATLEVPANTAAVQATLRGGSGDADLVLLSGSNDYYSERDGNNETLTLANPPAATVYVLAYAYEAYSNVALTASALAPPALDPNAAVKGLSGVEGSETLYRIALPAGLKSFTVSTAGGDGDVDILLRKGKPAVCQSSSRVYEPCQYDRRSLKYGNTESIAISSPGEGDWYLDLSAYRTYSGVTLTTVAVAACNYSLAPAGRSWTSVGGSETISVTVESGCSWTPSSADSWVTLEGVAAVSGSGAVKYSVPANSGGFRRSSVSVGGVSFNIEQAAAAVDGATAAGFLAQIASGGGWKTTITLVNSGAAAVQTRLNFFANGGEALAFPLTFPKTRPAGSLSAATLDRTLAPGSELVMETTGPDSQTALVGWAQLLATGNVSGFAVFRNEALKWEAVVPLDARAETAYTLAFDNTEKIATGLAVANLSASSADIAVAFRDDKGAALGTSKITLAPHGHSSFMLDPAADSNSPDRAAVTRGKRGTATFAASAGQIGVLGLRSAPVGTGLGLTTLPILADAAPFEGSFAHVAFGGGWQTTFTLTNLGAAQADATLRFLGDAGAPVTAPLRYPQSQTSERLTSLTKTLAAGESLVVNAWDDAALVQGSAQFTTTGHVAGFAVFLNEAQQWEAVVPLETRGAKSYVLAFDNTGGVATGVAVSGGQNPEQVALNFRDEDGTLLGSGTLSLTAFGHKAFMLDPAADPNSPDRDGVTRNRRGAVEFLAPAGGALSVVGLRSAPIGSGSSLTTLPALLK